MTRPAPPVPPAPTRTGTLVLPLDHNASALAGRRFVPYCNRCTWTGSAERSVDDARSLQAVHTCSA